MRTSPFFLIVYLSLHLSGCASESHKANSSYAASNPHIFKTETIAPMSAQESKINTAAAISNYNKIKSAHQAAIKDLKRKLHVSHCVVERLEGSFRYEVTKAKIYNERAEWNCEDKKHGALYEQNNWSKETKIHPLLKTNPSNELVFLNRGRGACYWFQGIDAHKYLDSYDAFDDLINCH